MIVVIITCCCMKKKNSDENKVEVVAMNYGDTVEYSQNDMNQQNLNIMKYNN